MQAGLGAPQLAQAAGVDVSYLRKLETGARTRMRPERYTALRTALNATDDQLLRDPPRGFTERE
jgi:transcriptional regulator with XRE-family HTH domain